MRSLLFRLMALFGSGAVVSEPPPLLPNAEYDGLEMEHPGYQSVRPLNNPFF